MLDILSLILSCSFSSFLFCFSSFLYFLLSFSNFFLFLILFFLFLSFSGAFPFSPLLCAFSFVIVSSLSFIFSSSVCILLFILFIFLYDLSLWFLIMWNMQSCCFMHIRSIIAGYAGWPRLLVFFWVILLMSILERFLGILCQNLLYKLLDH